MVYTIDNFHAGSAYWTQTNGAHDYSQPKARNSDVNQVNQYQYNAAGQLAAQSSSIRSATARSPITRPPATSTFRTCPVSSADWLTGDQLVATVYPDCTLSTPAVLADVKYNLQYPGVQSGGTAGNDIVALAYYANGAEYTKTDRAAWSISTTTTHSAARPRTT